MVQVPRLAIAGMVDAVTVGGASGLAGGQSIEPYAGYLHLQEFATGLLPWPLTVAATESLIDVLERRAGLDPDPSRDRSAQVSRVAVDESVGGLRHTVRQSAPGGDALVARYDELLDWYGVVDLPDGDLVHGDFNTCNVLQHHDAVTAVIDIEGLGSGTKLRHEPAVVNPTVEALHQMADDLKDPRSDEG